MRSGLLLLSTIVGLCVAVPSFAQELDVRIGHRDHNRGIARAHAEYGPGVNVTMIADGTATGIMIAAHTAGS